MQKERCNFDKILYLREIEDLQYNEQTIINVTDCNVNDEQISILKNISNKDKIYVQDNNWFGGIWKLNDYLRAEDILDEVATKIKHLSPFEKFICAYHFATNREYKFAPKGSSFQECRSYVDVLNKGYCVCVGYATILKRLAEKLGLQCAVQGCLAKDKDGKKTNHANCLVFLNDKKYKINGLYYSDPRMDCIDFKQEGAWNLNMLAIPITDISQILIKLWDDDTIIEMNDFQSIYYSRKPTSLDLEYFGKFFNFVDAKEIMQLKYCKPITSQQISAALFQIGLSEKEVVATLENYKSRKGLFLQDFASSKISSEWERRLAFIRYIKEYLSHAGRKDNVCKLDCATFVYRLYKNFFGVDIIEGGYGGSWTGKILTAKIGEGPNLLNENQFLQQKINFIDKNCKVGDILFFHRQSQSAKSVSNENYFPGHCGIYLGNHKYIDSRLTTRGDIAVVDIENDNYMQYFIGYKDIISSISNATDVCEEK